MELKWLEDFLSLAATRSFSTSATERNVTQSAFSRRIRSLEVWLGVTLLDRSTYPIRLTEDGKHFQEAAEEIVRLTYQTRAGLGQAAPKGQISLTALHSLTLTFLPKWLKRVGPVSSRVLPENYALCLEALVDGGYDFMLTYHHPSIPVPLDPARFPWKVVGADSLCAVATPEALAAPGPLPLLTYSRGSFLGRLTAVAQAQPGAPETRIAHVNENSLAEALKFMALEGHGLAWLPRQLVAAELEAGRLQVAAPELAMDIRLYRNGDRARGVVEQVWAAANYSETE
jgi:LysR family transcriptional regulator, hypochlorite-specific transcription factor HypT